MVGESSTTTLSQHGAPHLALSVAQVVNSLCNVCVFVCLCVG
jgi:hypothetical protein